MIENILTKIRSEKDIERRRGQVRKVVDFS